MSQVVFANNADSPTSGYTFLVQLKSTLFTGATVATKVRVRFTAGTSAPLVLGDVFIGPATTVPNTSSYTRMLFGGSHSSPSMPIGTTQWTDYLTIAFDGTKDWMVSFYPSSGNAEYLVSATGTHTYQSGTAVNDAGNVSPSGYTNSDILFCVSGIEWINEATVPPTSGSFSFTGEASGVSTARTPAANYGSFAFTGYAAIIGILKNISAALGSFALTGYSAVISAQRIVAAAFASFSVAGQIAGTAVGFVIGAVSGAFAFTGLSVVINKVKIMAADYASYSMSGFSSLFVKLPGEPLLRNVRAKMNQIRQSTARLYR